MKSFCIIFTRDGDSSKNPCRFGTVLRYAMEHVTIILRLSLSWMKVNMAEFWKSKVWLFKILWETKKTSGSIKTTKQIVKNNSKNANSLSNTYVYKIRCLNYNKFYIGETNRNLNKRFYELKKDLKTGRVTKSWAFHNILTNHTFDLQNSVIFAFIDDRDKRRIIEACSTPYHNIMPQR